jgi:DUF917 family protein
VSECNNTLRHRATVLQLGVRMIELSIEDIEALAVGAWILGTGGGGRPYHGRRKMRGLYEAGVRHGVLGPADLEGRG